MCQVWCSNIQGIYAELQGGNLSWVYVHCSIYIYIYIYIYRSAMRCAKCGVVVFKASILN